MKIIAGPCQLESSEHAIEIASALKELCEKYDFEFYFKSSFDKANRTSIHGKRGPGIFQGIQWLSDVRDEVGCKVLTDVHETWQIKEIINVADVIQIPAFLCRQTDLIVRSVELASLTDKIVNIKKGQFLAPWDVKGILSNSTKIMVDVEGGNNLLYLPLDKIMEENIPKNILIQGVDRKSVV